MAPVTRKRPSKADGPSARTKDPASTGADWSSSTTDHPPEKLSKRSNGKDNTGDIARRAKFQAWHRQRLNKLSSGNRKEDSNGQNGEPLKGTSLSPEAISTKSPLLAFCLSSMPKVLAGNTANEASESRPTSSGSSHSSCAPGLDATNGDNSAKETATPRTVRHNDSSFYRDICCVLCDEWICSRNRFIHIESHLKYRPYKCSLCEYKNRKEIFIQQHLRKRHQGQNGQPIFIENEDIVKRVWELADQSLQHTSRVLRAEAIQTAAASDKSNCQAPEVSTKSEIIERPFVANSKRRADAHPSVHDLPKEPEEQCTTCGYYVQRNSSTLGDHVRHHIPKAAYRCAKEGCLVSHCSRAFLYKHMKEGHQLRERVQDPLNEDRDLLEEYLSTCHDCFPSFYTMERLDRMRNRYRYSSYRNKTGDVSSSQQVAKREAKRRDHNTWQAVCVGCTRNLRLLGVDYTNGCCCCFDEKKCSSGAVGKVVCRVCLKAVPGKLIVLEGHALSHMVPLPLKCCHCTFSCSKLSAIRSHILEAHKHAHVKRVDFLWDGCNWKSLWKRCFDRCFNYLATFAAELPRRTCALCFEEVVDHPATMLDHTQQHVSVRKYGCIYCPTASANEVKAIATHIQQEHSCHPLVVQHFYDNRYTSSERLRVCQACFPGFKP